MTDFSPATWRLILEEEPRSGAANMAVDEALAESVAAGDSLPTLRFYRWQPAAVSLGRHQSVADVDESKVAEQGYDLVRRTTGGRAILHTDELTYSVAAPANEPRMEGGVMDAYLLMSNGLLAGLDGLGLAAEKAAGDVRAGRDVSAACFEVPSAYEITAGGRKLMGSAQSRRKGYVLQHGSLPLIGDITRLVGLLTLPQGEADALRTHLAERACTLAQALHVSDDSPLLDFRRVAESMADGLADALNVTWQPGHLSAAENRRTAELLRTRYADPEWTRHR
jgi:lipoate-protein ligase A